MATPDQTTIEDTSKQAQTAPVVDVDALKEELRAEAKAEVEAELKADREALEADKEEFQAEQKSAAANKAREAKRSAYKLPAEDKKILDALKLDENGKQKNADQVSGALGIETGRIIQVAYSNMNGESVYDLAARLGVTVNEIYEATSQEDMVRYKEHEDENGDRVREKFDYEG